MEHSQRCVFHLLEFYLKHIGNKATLADSRLSYEEYVARRNLIFELTEYMLEVNRALDLTRLLGMMNKSPILVCFYFVVRISLVVFNENERIKWVARVMIN